MYVSNFIDAENNTESTDAIMTTLSFSLMY